MENLLKYSDPIIVRRNLDKYYSKDIDLYLSSRKDKKYMIHHPKTKKYIHFGQNGYSDFTKHKDKQRQTLFLKRNQKWKDADMYTPAHLSYHLLWM
jgi:hypothetical protein